MTVRPVSPCQAGSHPCQQHLLIRARRRYGQGVAWAAGSGGAEAGSVRRVGWGRGTVGLQQAVKAPFVGSKFASHVGMLFLSHWI